MNLAESLKQRNLSVKDKGVLFRAWNTRKKVRLCVYIYIYAIELVKKTERLIKCSKNNILMLAYQRRKVFEKFKINNKFLSAVTEFGISKTTINFKIDIVKFIENCSRMKKSCISLFYFKNNFRVIKNICQGHTSEF